MTHIFDLVNKRILVTIFHHANNKISTCHSDHECFIYKEKITSEIITKYINPDNIPID